MDTNALQETLLMPVKGCTDNASIRSRYSFIEQLGKGSYGVVWKAQHRETKKLFAIKQIDKTRVRTKGLRELMSEVESMSILNHPNIVKLEETYQDDSSLWIVMEYLGCGTLDQMQEKKGTLSEESTRNIVTQLLRALEYIHARGIVHRDLKPANCLISEDGNTVKISDFGFAVLAGSEQCLTTYCGTVSFMAPEILMKLNYGKHVDMWALGILTYLLFTGEYPFSGENSNIVKHAILKNHSRVGHNKKLKEVPELCDFIHRLLKFEPMKRMTARESLEHPWIKPKMSSANEFASFTSHVRSNASENYSPTKSKALCFFRALVVTILAVNRLIYYQRCRRLERLGYGHLNVLRDLHFFITKRYEPKCSGKAVLYCSHTFSRCPMAITELLPMIAASQTIEEVNFSHNNISSLRLVQDILLTIGHHPCIEVLNLSYNPIPSVAGRALLRLARSSLSRLRRIDVIGTLIPVDVVKQLDALLKEKNGAVLTTNLRVSTGCTFSGRKTNSYLTKASTSGSTIPRLPFHSLVHSNESGSRDQSYRSRKADPRVEGSPDQLPYLSKNSPIHSSGKQNSNTSYLRKM